MIFIVINASIQTPLEKTLLEKAARAALQNQSAPEDVELTIALGDDAQLQQLNHDFLGIDAPTDVLSFPSAEIDPDTNARYLGDIIISVERAAGQAKAAGHTLGAEMQLLVAHGVLHLLGHDHAEADGKARMWSAQAEILKTLGLENIRIPE
jgi:probable rRNA maturation factor